MKGGEQERIQNEECEIICIYIHSLSNKQSRKGSRLVKASHSKEAH